MIFLAMIFMCISFLSHTMEHAAAGATEDTRPVAMRFDDTVARLHQEITYGSDFSHADKTGKNIFWSDLKDHFPDKVDECVRTAVLTGMLDEENPSAYRVTGVTDYELSAGTTIHGIQKSHHALEGLLRGFVAAHEEEVVEACVKPGLSGMTTTSKAVVSVCSCGQQLHRSCAKAGCRSGMTSCPNSFCSNKIDLAALLSKIQAGSARTRKKSKAKFVKAGDVKVDERTSVVKKSDVYTGDCAICLEPLQSEDD